MHINITINKCIGESSPVYLYCSKIETRGIKQCRQRMILIKRLMTLHEWAGRFVSLFF